MLELLNGEDTAVARERIAEHQSRKYSQDQNCTVVCAQCGQGGIYRKILEKHVETESVIYLIQCPFCYL